MTPNSLLFSKKISVIDVWLGPKYVSLSQKQLQRNIQINFCQIILRNSRSSRLQMFHKNVNVKIFSKCYSPAAWKFIEK